MAYTINKTDGTVLATIADGTLDTSTSLQLIGKNYAGYGEILNENTVKLLENFANSSSPTNPLTGQMYYNHLQQDHKVTYGMIQSTDRYMFTQALLGY